MKINEKSLAYFSSSSKTPVDKQGWLWKKGELNTSYQKRWCVLKGNLFFYFERSYDREPVGVIVIENCSVQLAEGGDSPYTFAISFVGTGLRTYKLTADDEATCNDWVRALSIASYSYLQILVDGLEKELQELKTTAKSSDNLLVSGSTTVIPGIPPSSSPAVVQSIDNNKLSVINQIEKKKSPKMRRRKKDKSDTANFYVDSAQLTQTDNVKLSPKATNLQVFGNAVRPFAAMHAGFQYDIIEYTENQLSTTISCPRD